MTIFMYILCKWSLRREERKLKVLIVKRKKKHIDLSGLLRTWAMAINNLSHFYFLMCSLYHCKNADSFITAEFSVQNTLPIWRVKTDLVPVLLLNESALFRDVFRHLFLWDSVLPGFWPFQEKTCFIVKWGSWESKHIQHLLLNESGFLKVIVNRLILPYRRFCWQRGIVRKWKFYPNANFAISLSIVKGLKPLQGSSDWLLFVFCTSLVFSKLQSANGFNWNPSFSTGL